MPQRKVKDDKSDWAYQAKTWAYQSIHPHSQEVT